MAMVRAGLAVFARASRRHSHYPGDKWDDHWNGNLFDEQAAANPQTEWWSASLNLNPEVVDATHSGARRTVKGARRRARTG